MNPNDFHVDHSPPLQAASSWWPTNEQWAEARKNCPPGAHPVVLDMGQIGYATPLPGEALTDKIKPGDIRDGARVTMVFSNGYDTEPITLREKLWAAVRGKQIA